jgi:hypothetical protein
MSVLHVMFWEIIVGIFAVFIFFFLGGEGDEWWCLCYVIYWEMIGGVCLVFHLLGDEWWCLCYMSSFER